MKLLIFLSPLQKSATNTVSSVPHCSLSSQARDSKQRKSHLLKKKLRKSSVVFSQLWGKCHFSPEPPFPLLLEGKTFPGRVCGGLAFSPALDAQACALRVEWGEDLSLKGLRRSLGVATSFCRASLSPVSAELGLVSVVRSQRSSNTAGADLGSCGLEGGPGTGLWGWTPAPRGVCWGDCRRGWAGGSTESVRFSAVGEVMGEGTGHRARDQRALLSDVKLTRRSLSRNLRTVRESVPKVWGGGRRLPVPRDQDGVHSVFVSCHWCRQWL